jgi:hypothetical protein
MVSPPIKLLACIASATEAMVGLNDELCALKLKIFGELIVDSERDLREPNSHSWLISSGVKVNDATVVTADIPASNGVIHAIDAVILPPGVDVAALIKK